MLYSKTLLVIYFLYSNVYLLNIHSLFIPPPISTLVTICLFSMPVSLFVL